MNWQEKEALQQFGCLFVIALLLVIPIGALFHIGWNLVGQAKCPRRRPSVPKGRQCPSPAPVDPLRFL